MNSDWKKKSEAYRERYMSFKRIMEGQRRIETPYELQQAEQWTQGCYPRLTPVKRPPLCQLTLMGLKNINIYQQYKGYYLKLKLLMPCCRLPGILGLCEDHTGEICIQINVVHLDLKGKHYDHYFRPGSFIYVKYPKVDTLGSGPALHIDRQSDILFDNHPEVLALEGWKPSNTQQFKELPLHEKIKQEDEEFKEVPSDEELKEMSQDEDYKEGSNDEELKEVSLYREEEYRLKGIKLIGNNEYARAYELYSDAIRKTVNQDYLLKFYLNKAIVCVHFKLLKQYAQNINLALKINPKNKKGLYHRIKHLILTNNEKQATQIMMKYEDIFDEQTNKEIIKFLELERSFKENKIDWCKAMTSLQLGEYQADCIEFTKGQYGLGMFAKKDIQPGEILIVEKPFLWAEHHIRESSQNLAEIILTPKIKEDAKILYDWSGEFREKIKDLPLGQALKEGKKKRKKSMKKDKMMDLIINRNLCDMFELQQYVKKESFDMNQLGLAPKNMLVSINKMGLFERISLINHRCEPNCQRVCLGPAMIVYATDYITSGREIFISYTKNLKFFQRKEFLKARGCECACLYCKQLEKQWYGDEYEPSSKSMKLYRLSHTFNQEQECNKENLKKLANSYNLGLLRRLSRSDIPELASQLLRSVFPITKQQSEQYLKDRMAE